MAAHEKIDKTENEFIQSSKNADDTSEKKIRVFSFC